MISIKTGRALQLEIEEKFGMHIHIHDQCGYGQWFGLDERNDEVTEYIVNWLTERGIEYDVSNNGQIIGTK